MEIFKQNAAEYAKNGLAVFPVIANGKVPLTPKGCLDASLDPAQIEEWSEVYPNANLGIACGPSNIVVLDVDGDEGKKSLKELFDAEPAIKRACTATRAVRTGTGGYHFWFKTRENVEIRNSASKLGTGLDVRAVGGYVIAPPSINANGDAYQWFQESEPVELPLELVAKLKVERWKVSEKLSADPIGEGGRNDFLMRAGCSMRAKGFEAEEIDGALQAMNLGRCVPPLDGDEVSKIVESVCRYERGDAIERVREYQAKDPTQGRKKFKLTQYSDIKPVDIDWLLPGYISKGKFNLCFGMEGRGKSYATCGIAADLTTGKPLPGVQMVMGLSPKSVLLLTYEDDPNDTIAPRLRKCGADMSKVYTVHYNDGMVTHRDMDALEETIKEIPDLALLVIDPLTAFANVENTGSQEQITAAMNPLIRLAMQRKFAIVGVKHTNKDEDKSVSNRISGSRGWTALARSVFLVGHDNAKENGEFETYGGMVSVKGNLAGSVKPLTYRIKDGLFEFTGYDDTMTPERLLPEKKKKGEEK